MRRLEHGEVESPAAEPARHDVVDVPALLGVDRLPAARAGSRQGRGDPDPDRLHPAPSPLLRRTGEGS